jgi:hypothetical protein
VGILAVGEGVVEGDLQLLPSTSNSMEFGVTATIRADSGAWMPP